MQIFVLINLLGFFPIPCNGPACFPWCLEGLSYSSLNLFQFSFPVLSTKLILMLVAFS